MYLWRGGEIKLSVSDTSSFITVVLGLMLPMVLLLGIDIIFGVISLNMAKKRDLSQVPAFFAGFFGSFVTLFIIAMFPKKTNY